MIGPHYEKIAEVEQKLTSKQMLSRIREKSDNPLTNLVEKIKKEFADYDTAYNSDVINHSIPSVDKMLAHDGKLGPILSFIEKENNTLRRELSILESQLSNTMGICEHILDENAQLKHIIDKKNEDLRKIIETIAYNESEARNELEDKIALLQEENAILISHLSDVKKEHASYVDKFSIKEKEINTTHSKLEECKKSLGQAIKNEHNLSRKLSLSEHNLYQQTEKIYDLEQLNQNLKFDNNELKNQLLMYKDEGKHISVENVRYKLESEYKNILDEHRELKQERSNLMRECETLKIDNEKLQSNVAEYEKKFNKVNNDLQLTTSLLNEQKQKNANLGNNITKLENKILELKEENTRLQLEVDSVNSYSMSRESSLQREIGNLRSQLDEKSHDTEKIVLDVREKTRLLLQQKEIEMESLNQTNKELRRLLEMREG